MVKYMIIFLVSLFYLCLSPMTYGLDQLTVDIFQKQNIAFGKKATQSSNAGLPELAVDGNQSTNFSDGSCTHSSYYDTGTAWWSVDLGTVYNITEIRITNRGDCCGSNLRNFFIFLGNDSYVNSSLCKYYGKDVDDGATIAVKCLRNSVSRFIKIQLNSNEVLSLCEVQVFADSLNNIALGKAAYQSSDLGAAVLAVDNNTDSAFTHGSCSLTAPNPLQTPWWTVDLGAVFNISLIKITNTGDSRWQTLKDFDVILGDYYNQSLSLCVHYNGSVKAGSTVSVVCQLTNVGRYVSVRLNRKDMLCLCEVQIFGTPVSIQFPSLAEKIRTVFESTAFQTTPDTDTIDSKAVNLTTNTPTSHTLTDAIPASVLAMFSNDTNTCMYYCANWTNKAKPSAEELQRIIEMIQKVLIVRRNETSKFRRKRISATDKRVSAKRIGFLGIFFFSGVLSLILLSDIASLIQQFCPSLSKWKTVFK